MAAKIYGGFIDVGGFTDHIERRASFSEERRQVLSFDLSIPHGCSSQLLKHAGAEAPSISAERLPGRRRVNLATVRAERSCRALLLIRSRRRTRPSTPPRVVSVRAASSSSSSDAQVLRERFCLRAVGSDRPVVVFDQLPSSDSKPICETRPGRGVRRGGHGVARRPEKSGAAGPLVPLYLDKDAAIKEFGARIIEIAIQIPQVVFYGPAEDPEADEAMCAPGLGGATIRRARGSRC